MRGSHCCTCFACRAAWRSLRTVAALRDRLDAIGDLPSRPEVAQTLFVGAADRAYDDSAPSARDRINENVKELDAPVLNMGEVRTRDGYGAIGRARPPEESCGAVVA